jgi:hypothetical protein
MSDLGGRMSACFRHPTSYIRHRETPQYKLRFLLYFHKIASSQPSNSRACGLKLMPIPILMRLSAA